MTREMNDLDGSLFLALIQSFVVDWGQSTDQLTFFIRRLGVRSNYTHKCTNLL